MSWATPESTASLLERFSNAKTKAAAIPNHASLGKSNILFFGCQNCFLATSSSPRPRNRGVFRFGFDFLLKFEPAGFSGLGGPSETCHLYFPSQFQSRNCIVFFQVARGVASFLQRTWSCSRAKRQAGRGSRGLCRSGS